MKNIFILFISFLMSSVCIAQTTTMINKQYFDGEDTFYSDPYFYYSIKVDIDTSNSNNIWQVGMPQKTIFDSAATLPNAIVTDTLNYYPNNDSSSFSFTIPRSFQWGVAAIQWKQKIDFENGKDGGKIEFSTDSGLTWHSVFDNPFTYNFYGFDSVNVDTLVDGTWVFTGTDTTWRDVWLCFDYSWMTHFEGVQLKFTNLSDGDTSNNEGWMIDNMMVHRTLIHVGIKKQKREKVFQVYPNPVNDRLHIDIENIMEYHLIEEMSLVDYTGKQIKEWKKVPTKFFIDTKAYPEGVYYLNIKTNKLSETLPIVIKRNQ